MLCVDVDPGLGGAAAQIRARRGLGLAESPRGVEERTEHQDDRRDQHQPTPVGSHVARDKDDHPADHDRDQRGDERARRGAFAGARRRCSRRKSRRVTKRQKKVQETPYVRTLRSRSICGVPSRSAIDCFLWRFARTRIPIGFIAVIVRRSRSHARGRGLADGDERGGGFRRGEPRLGGARDLGLVVGVDLGEAELAGLGCLGGSGRALPAGRKMSRCHFRWRSGWVPAGRRRCPGPRRARCAGVSSPELLIGSAGAADPPREAPRPSAGAARRSAAERCRRCCVCAESSRPSGTAPKAASQGAEALSLQLGSSCLSVL